MDNFTKINGKFYENFTKKSGKCYGKLLQNVAIIILRKFLENFI